MIQTLLSKDDNSIPMLERKTKFLAKKICSLEYKGKIFIPNKMKYRYSYVIFEEDTIFINLNKVLLHPNLEFCLDEILIYNLAKYYNYINGLLFNDDCNDLKYLLEDMRNCGFYSNKTFFIKNNVAYYKDQGNLIYWEPTIEQIELNIEFDYQYFT
ncbi:hypothetical protein GRF59_15090 [Paenibacillus sp. HJL G12]|uniref:Uncharacterized protein n=1 Tax=Paenibacillus dendrobii TaxID=2691084 RepID=A0A7X3LGN6_9BACL|nr:hypothetical protein [Paenibacillus dendrobii]MWV44946.1 hypothetical protein [Paenibacillus dendrobii]